MMDTSPTPEKYYTARDGIGRSKSIENNWDGEDTPKLTFCHPPTPSTFLRQSIGNGLYGAANHRAPTLACKALLGKLQLLRGLALNTSYVLHKMGTMMKGHLVHRECTLHNLLTLTTAMARYFVNTCLLRILIAGVLPQKISTYISVQMEPLPHHPERRSKDSAPHTGRQRRVRESHVTTHCCCISVYPPTRY